MLLNVFGVGVVGEPQWEVVGQNYCLDAIPGLHRHNMQFGLQWVRSRGEKIEVGVCDYSREGNRWVYSAKYRFGPLMLYMQRNIHLERTVLGLESMLLGPIGSATGVLSSEYQG